MLSFCPFVFKYVVLEFSDLLRGLSADSEDTIRASTDALGKHGFINYFGLQVFLLLFYVTA